MLTLADMNILNRREPVILFAGDLLAFSVALWLALAFRYGAIPSIELLSQHFVPFALLFALWTLIFFIAGLYEKNILVFKGKLPALILNTQITSSLIAVVFFYLFPFFGITPKTVLAVHLIISFFLVVLWRIFLVPSFYLRRTEYAILIGAGPEMQELKEEVNANRRYNLTFVSSIDLEKLDGILFQEEVVEKVYSGRVSSIVIDLRHKKTNTMLPALYNLIFSNVRFLDMYKVYEEIFDRIPLSRVGYNWFLENISFSPHTMYDMLKRLMDVTIAGVLGALTLVVYPLVIIAIKLDDGGPIFIFQDRIGKNNSVIRIVKFRSMARNAIRKNVITRAGRFLRATRIDELPQLWNVVKGDLSLVGPRPELPEFVKVYEKEIPYYKMRHLVTPGLSGWGQIKDYNVPRGTADVDKTRTKLSYDLYYIKNRSFILDITIALKTLKTLLSRSGN